MRRTDQSRGKKRSCALIAALILLTGCSKITAGTSPDIQATPAEAETDVTEYFDGDGVIKAQVTIGKGVPVWEAPGSPDTSRIPQDDICTLMCHKIDLTGDVRPIQAVSENGAQIELMGVEYDGAGYPIGNGWYGFLIPNGYGKYYIKIGNKIFEGGNT